MFRQWLYDRRNEKQLSQKQVANICGVSQQFLSLLEQGLKNPRPITAKRIANVLEFDWQRFFEENDEEEIKKNANKNLSA